jgi:peptidoglycan/xylan/chitin deacetylase (PgdA/CDA1 family)
MPNGLKDRARAYLKRSLIRGGLEASAVLAALGAFPGARGRGAIFTLHHVRPARPGGFQPNALLEVTPEFLETAIVTLRDAGCDFIPLAALPARLAGPAAPPFACFTLDDGYRDNARHAVPVFTRYGVPFTILLTSGFVDASRSLWWETLEALLRQESRLSVDLGHGRVAITAGTPAEKRAAFNRIAGVINTADERDAIARLDGAAAAHGIDPLRITADETMRADELQALLANPLASYGAHTATHRGLARLPPAEAEAEIARSMETVAALTGAAPATFAYPYGDARSVVPHVRDILRSLGIVIGVTTRPGTLRPEMAADLTAAPRISLNGLYQKSRYVRALASGIPFRLMGAGRTV